MALSMTQEKYDNLVNGLAEHQVLLADKASIMHLQNDPDVFRLEEELMLVTNIIEAMKHYDVDWDHFTDEEIRYYIELGTSLVDNCPIQ